MKNNKKLFLLPVALVTVFTLVACGSLSDEQSIWNQTREVEADDTPATDNGSDGMTFNPGVYEGVGTVRGYGGVMTVEVTVGDDGRISDVEIINHGESEDWFNMAAPSLIENVINAQSGDIDGVSGATYTSGAFIDAVQVALSQAGGTSTGDGSSDDGGGDAAGHFTEGTFEGIGTVRGYGGVMTVEVTIDNSGRISDIEVTNHGESEDWFNMASPILIENVIDSQSADIDGVSGATYTSGAFIDAVRVALEEAE